MFTIKEFDMGFRNGAKPGAANRKGHRWINYPNTAHKKCTKCGCFVDIVSTKEGSKTLYKDKYGNYLDCCPDCVEQN